MALSTRTAGRPVLNATRARQGRLGRPVLWVLMTTLLLVVLGFFAAWTWKAPGLARVEPSHGERQAAAQRFDTPAPAPVTRQNETVGGEQAPR